MFQDNYSAQYKTMYIFKSRGNEESDIAYFLISFYGKKILSMIIRTLVLEWQLYS